MRTKLVAGALVAGAIALAVLMFGRDQGESLEYTTRPAEIGTIRTVVNATGTVQPVVTVTVGSQVSGKIQELYADFNSIVKQGQLLARIDPRDSQAQVANARARVDGAQARLKAARAQLNTAAASIASAKAGLNDARVGVDNTAMLLSQAEDMKPEGLVSGNDFDTAQLNAKTAQARLQQAQAAVQQAEAGQSSAKAGIDESQAQLDQAEADYRQAQNNLGYTRIYSPVDGVVISRDVDVGQTIASSFQSPTLFTIATDLTKMQVSASIDEADIGNISSADRVRFTVDAYPNESFNGKINEIRLNPSTVQNVVTYNAILEIENPELKLKPGMTANVTITVEQKTGILKVPNAALRYNPPGVEPQPIRVTGTIGGDESVGPPTAVPQALKAPQAPGQKWDPARKIHFDHSTEEVIRSARVWILSAGNAPEARSILLGVTDGVSTEVVSGPLKAGDAVITADSSAATSPGQNRARNPLLPLPRLRGGRGR